MLLLIILIEWLIKCHLNIPEVPILLFMLSLGEKKALYPCLTKTDIFQNAPDGNFVLEIRECLALDGMSLLEASRLLCRGNSFGFFCEGQLYQVSILYFRDGKKFVNVSFH